MANEPKPSFSKSRKWMIGFNVIFAIFVAVAIVALLNYLSSRFSRRSYLSTRTQIELSSLTVSVVKSLTNKVDVTLYYDRDEPFYGDIVDLLKQYGEHHPNFSVQMVDYLHNPGVAEQVKTRYKLLSADDKDLVIFDSEGRVKVVSGRDIVTSQFLELTNTTERTYRRKPVSFNGEILFTSALLAVTSSEPLKACFLEGHGERRIDDYSDGGYRSLTNILSRSYIESKAISLLGTNVVPGDCDLLVVAGPVMPIPEIELQRIEEYLNQGGRMLALLDARAVNRTTGLEKLLVKWGVTVGNDVVIDPDTRVGEQDLVISGFTRHPSVEPLLGSGLYMTVPRPVHPRELPSQLNDAPRVQILAATTPNAYLNGDPLQRRDQFPVAVAVEKTGVRGVAAESGATRILVVGDTFFLSNGQIEQFANRDFAGLAANWLLDRHFMIKGVGPREIHEYRILLPEKQLQTLQWILLGVMPGSVLLLGGIVWIRRRR